MTLSKTKLTLTVALALQQLANPAFADTAAPAKADSAKDPVKQLSGVKVVGQQKKDEYTPDTSSIGAKIPTQLRDIPQTITVINRAVLNEQAANSMTEALRNVPGITISAGEGGAIGDNINLRGFSARTDMFIDGFRDRGQYTRDTFAIEAVEVLKGPSSMLFGRGSTGGVINQASKKPSLKAAAELKLTVGTDDYYRATADLNRPLSDTSAFRMAAMAQDSKSTRDLVHNKAFGLAPSLSFGLGSPTTVTISGLLQRNDEMPDYGLPFVRSSDSNPLRKPVKAPASRNYAYSDDQFKQDVNVLGVSLRHKISPTLTLSNRLQYSKYHTDASPTALGAVTRTGGGTPTLNDALSILSAPRQDKQRKLDDQSLFNQTDLVAKFSTGAIAHTLASGVEFGRDKARDDRYVWNPTNVAVILGEPAQGPRPNVNALSRSVTTTANTAAIYINDQLDLDKQWKVVGGLRWDRFSANSTLQKFALPAGFKADTATAVPGRTDTMLSSRAGVIFQPSDVQSFYLSYGTSFNPSTETVSLSANTAKLDPEKNRSIELGSKLDLLDGALSFNTALFQVQKTNARTTDAITKETTLDGKVRVQGVEVGLVGRISPSWQVLAGYTLLDGKVLESKDVGSNADVGIKTEGNTLQNTPRHNFSLWTTYTLAQNWDIGGGLVYASDRFVNNYETSRVDGYTRFDATLAYKQPNYEVRINLQNLSNAYYFETASGGRAVPAKGRSALASVSYRF